MLNELLTLRRNLESVESELPTRHPDVKTPGRFPGYRVNLDEDGRPAGIAELQAEEMSRLWTIREGKHNSFPVIKVQQALLDVPADDPIRQRLRDLKAGQDRRGVVAECVSRFRQHSLSSDLRVWQRLRVKAGRLLPFFEKGDGPYCAWPELLRRFGGSELPPEQFLKALTQVIAEGLRQTHLADGALAERLLLGRVTGHGPAKAEVPIVLDLDRWDRSKGYRVADPAMESFVNRRLSEQPSSDLPPTALGRCALSEDEAPVELVRNLFPAPNLPLLGETYLVSMNSDIPCQTRYGLTGTAVVPVGRMTATDLANGLSFITAKSRKDKTWRPVANGKFETSGGRKREKQDLLVVYVEGQPDSSTELATLFGSDAKSVQRQFETDAKTVCDALRGVRDARPESHLNLFLLRQEDKGRRQVALSLSPQVSDVLDAVERWESVVRKNLPSITLRFPGKRGEKGPTRCPSPPYPETIVRLLSRIWVRGGTESYAAEGVDLGIVLHFLLSLRQGQDYLDRDLALMLLEQTLKRTGPLLIGVTAAFGSDNKDQWALFPAEARQVALQSVSFLGILLDALERPKDAYMNDTAFLLGRSLSLADTLHREYCRHVRGGGTPPQLIGNAHVAVAAENPEEALDRLRERMMVYRAWADKSDGEQFRLARWTVGEMGRICAQLQRPLPSPSETGRTFRAELFLGYMARPEREQVIEAKIQPVEGESNAE